LQGCGAKLPLRDGTFGYIVSNPQRQLGNGSNAVVRCKFHRAPRLSTTRGTINTRLLDCNEFDGLKNLFWLHASGDTHSISLPVLIELRLNELSDVSPKLATSPPHRQNNV
jgi:hypothetical protein